VAPAVSSSRSDDAMVAVGFNPRNMCRSPTMLRRVATPQSSLRDEWKLGGTPDRGLKPTATIMMSLRDELEPIRR
jgi:hypothetical protein